MLSTLLTVVSASLFGSLHCAAMCGGLVSFTCGTSERPRLAQALYHGSRLTAYAGLGAIAGFVGQSLNQRVDVAGYQNVAALVSGGAMIAWALVSLMRRWHAGAASSAAAPTPLVALQPRKPAATGLSVWFARLHALPSALRGALLGLTSAILPCGWLYTFVTASAGQGSPAAGALVMFAFWLGTLPMLLGLGSLVSLLGSKVQSYLPQLSVVVLLALGLGTILLRHPSTPKDVAGSAASHHACH